MKTYLERKKYRNFCSYTHPTGNSLDSIWVATDWSESAELI